MASRQAPIFWTLSLGLSSKPGWKSLFIVASGTWVFLLGCSVWRLKDPPTPVENRDLETLNTIVSEVLFEKDTDTYRLPMPRDAEGKNLFYSAIDRLESWRRRNPGQSEDIVYYTEGLCYEKLGQARNALETYSLVHSSDPDLTKATEERIVRLEEILSYFPDEEEKQSEVERKGTAEEAIKKFKGTEWEPLVWILAENEAVREALAKRDATGQVASIAYKDALEKLISRFKESRRIYEHWMRLGLYYENVAREWITLGEYGNNKKAWKLADQALQKCSEIYLKVSQADGYPEKREAQAKLVALEELSRKIETNLVE